MNSDNGFRIVAVDGSGGGFNIDPAEAVNSLVSEGSYYWIHVDYSRDKSRNRLLELYWLDPIVMDHLLEETTSPRSVIVNTGILLGLKGVNLNPGENPEDMIGVRLWVDEKIVITSSRRNLQSLNDIAEYIRKGKGPVNTAEFITLLLERLSFHADDVIEKLLDRIDVFEDMLTAESAPARIQLAIIRRQSLRLRRYFAPQVEAIIHMLGDPPAWLTKRNRMHIRESLNRYKRYLEELNFIGERATVSQEEVLGRLSEHINRRMYVLSLVATIFLPLSFFTGLLGMNVGGIPGAESEVGFAALCGILLAFVAGVLLVLRLKKWI